MKRKVVSLLMATAMTVAMLAGCGSDGSGSNTGSAASTDSSDTTQAADDETADV